MNAAKFRVDNEAMPGGSFHGVIVRASLATMVKLFGPPIDTCDSKTTHEWEFVESTGMFVVSVYDYKYNGRYEEHWHVGTETREQSEEFKRWFDFVVRGSQ